jgi:hypothetical protein
MSAAISKLLAFMLIVAGSILFGFALSRVIGKF